MRSNTAERQFSLDQVSCAEGNKEWHSIISRLASFSPPFKFYKFSTWSRSCRELQMCIGDKAGSVLVSPVLDVQKVQLQEAVLALPGMMGESWEGEEEAGI